MKSILMSIQPYYAYLETKGIKTIEVRKTAPKEVPFKVYIYCTKDKRGKIGKPSINYKTVGIWEKTFCPPSFVGFGGKVIGEFICDKVEEFIACTVPYEKTNNLGYEHFIDNGVYDLNGKGVVFERMDKYIDTMINNSDLTKICLTYKELENYIRVGRKGYAIHISALKVYDKPKELWEFSHKVKGKYAPFTRAVTHAPQSYIYVADLEEVE